jgi:hypothetical protein
MKSKNVPAPSGTSGIEGMAKDEKSPTPPSMIDAPKALVPIMQAFYIESPKLAKSMVLEAARAIYGKESAYGREIPISKSELDGIVSLIRSIKPKDSLESLFAAQIIVGHMLGMRKLSENCADDQRLGLNLLRFSSEAMQMLIKKQSGATQNIIVNYSYNGQGNALMQTVLPNGGH